MKQTIKTLLKAFFPQRCAYCGSVIAPDEFMCEECERILPRITGEICIKCGREEKTECFCKKAENYYDGIAAPFYFCGNVRSGVHSFKFRSSPDCAEAFGYEMSETVKRRFSNINFDYITEVPVSSGSLKARGYNQCFLLAREISKNTGIEHKSDVLIKLYETDKQHGLKHYLRKGNLTGVFDVNNPAGVEGKSILLCDDISTTGETLNECAKMLWLYGAKEVYCISVALTKKHK
ncbi:MAG: ComF family protein [Clostridia bacterium]|nr:ComF family protein [Clostridia bacterium]